MNAVPIELSALFEALGPQTDAVDWVTFDATGVSWTVGFDDDSAILLEWDGERGRLMFQAPLGRPAEHAGLAVYRAVLGYNALWRKNGGGRIGMVDAEGELALMIDVPAHGLTLEQLQRVLLGVRAMAAAWTRCVASLDEGDTASAMTMEQHLYRG